MYLLLILTAAAGLPDNLNDNTLRYIERIKRGRHRPVCLVMISKMLSRVPMVITYTTTSVRSFYPSTSSTYPVPVLILHPREVTKNTEYDVREIILCNAVRRGDNSTHEDSISEKTGICNETTK